MDILFLLIPLSFVLISIAIYLFFWAVKDGQFDDLDGSAHSILFEDDKPSAKLKVEKNAREIDSVKGEKKPAESSSEGESS